MSAVTTDMPRQTSSERSLAGMALRGVLGLAGAALCVSAFGLWLVPGAAGMPELSLIKLGLSVYMLIGGLCCLVTARAGRAG